MNNYEKISNKKKSKDLDKNSSKIKFANLMYIDNITLLTARFNGSLLEGSAC